MCKCSSTDEKPEIPPLTLAVGGPLCLLAFGQVVDHLASPIALAPPKLSSAQGRRAEERPNEEMCEKRWSDQRTCLPLPRAQRKLPADGTRDARFFSSDSLLLTLSSPLLAVA